LNSEHLNLELFLLGEERKNYKTRYRFSKFGKEKKINFLFFFLSTQIKEI